MGQAGTVSDTPNPTDHSAPIDAGPEQPDTKTAGLPLWVPFAGLLAAFALAVFIGARICPTMIGLVFPPEPPLPAGEIRIKEQFSLGAGKDEWLYSTAIEPCTVLQYYKDRLGSCQLDPETFCEMPGFGTAPRDGSSFPIATCQGVTTTGGVNTYWTVRIGGGYTPPEITRFRLTRETGN